MISYYKIRVDVHDDPKIITKGHSKYAYCYEGTDTDNNHMHFYLETTLTRASIVSRIKKFKDFKPGNGFYSCRELVPDADDTKFKKYLAYIMKENKSTFVGFSEEQFSEIKLYNDTVKQEIKERKEKKKPVLDQIIAHYDYEANPPMDQMQVVDEVIQFYKETGRLVREFAMVSQVQTLLLRYCPEYKSQLANNIYRAINKT